MFEGIDKIKYASFLRHIKTDAESGCWIWTGYINDSGYGMSHVMGISSGLSHRISYEIVNGPIPDGLVLDHYVCQNPPCVNPNHLEAVTQRVNVERGNGLCAQNMRKTHCPRGHAYTEDNLVLSQLKFGRRECSICMREARREYRRKQCAKEGRELQLPSALKTHCPRGHALIEENCVVHKWKEGARICRVCKNEKSRFRDLSKREGTYVPTKVTANEFTDKKECIRGHAWTEENFNKSALARGKKVCNLCKVMTDRVAHAKKKMEAKGVIDYEKLKQLEAEPVKFQLVGPALENSTKTHCLNGHPLSGDNLIKFQLSKGIRACKACANIRKKGYRLRDKNKESETTTNE